MASIPYNSTEDGKPMPVWSIVMIVIVISSLAVGLGFMIWTGRTKPCKEEARREIDLERASLEAEAKWQRSLRKAEVEEIEERQRQRQRGRKLS
jgi:Flp pilus assembly protein TadB